MIKYYKRKYIDDERWDKTIAGSSFGNVYALSWYLDATEAHWGALIMDDYKFVMPVVQGRKFGFTYVYQPRFCQQLGVFSPVEVDAQIARSFLLSLPEHYKYGDYAFNEGNVLAEEKYIEVKDYVNYSLDLNGPVEDVTGYATNCRRNVQRASKSGLLPDDFLEVEELVRLKQSYDSERKGEAHYRLLIRMFSHLVKEGHAEARGVRMEGRLCGGAIFVYGAGRIHYLLSVSTEEGKENRAMFMILDRVIREHAGKDLRLDFEGSNRSSIARFFGGFGGIPAAYQRVSFYRGLGKLYYKLKRAGLV